MLYIHSSCQALCTAVLAICLLAVNCLAEDPLEVLPKVSRLDSIKTPQQFYGFAIGSRHLRHDQVVDYLQYLAGVSDRVHLLQYGLTHGQRPLLACVISHPTNVAKLDQLQKQRRKLTTGKFKGSVGDQLLVMSMGYCVHGDEASAVNCAPLVAYHLASAQDEQTLKFLQQSIALLDPALNPDGVDRFANWANENRGYYASPNPIDREHQQPWPGGRTNYYMFDLNRDWLPAVHPESSGRIKLFHAWKPNVVLDFHEMGGNSSFFFQPGEPKRINPYSPQENRRLTKLFAAEHARVMDDANELFYSEENFDDFYIGKGSTYPDLQGAVGILFEQASTRGLKFANQRVSRHFRDTIANQLRMSLSSLHSATEQHDQLLQLQVDFFKTALQTAEQHAVKAYLLTGSPSRLAAAAQLLKLHSVQVYRPEQQISFEGSNYAADSVLVLPLAQPQHFLVRSLMEPQQEFEQNVFYDVSTWHLPSAFDIQTQEVRTDIPANWLGSSAVVQTAHDQSQVSGQDFEKVIGWAIPPQELSVPKLIVALQQVNAQIRVTTQLAQLGGTELPFGTFVVMKQPNQKVWAQVQRVISQQAQQAGATCLPVLSSSTSEGPDFGSNTLLDLPRCKPLLVMGSGTSAYSAGSLWYFIDHRLRLPVDTLDVERLSSANLDDYSCIVLPEGSYSTLTVNTSDQLADYVKRGGTVIAIGSAIGVLQRNKLLSTEENSRPSTADGAATKSPRFADADDDSALESIAGAFFDTSIDRTHPLAFGFPDDHVPTFRVSTKHYAVPTNSYQLIAQYQHVIAGYVSENNRQRLSGSAAAWVTTSGSGKYILLADNPVFRGYVRGSERFLVNAMFIGPAFQLPSGGSGDGDELEEQD